MGKVLDTALSPSVIDQAWQAYRTDHTPWKRGIPWQVAQSHLLKYAGELVADTRAGRYLPEPMRCYEVAKASGGTRVLCSSPVRDKLLQRAVLIALEPLGEALFHPSSFGYRPNCTVDMALKKIHYWVERGWVWLGDADISACFDHIPHTPLLNQLLSLCNDQAILPLVESWLFSMPPEFRRTGHGRGLPQGLVLSPFLCNLYLHLLDQHLERAGIPFVRYADDFILLARSQQDAASALSQAGGILKRLQLKLNPEKTRVVRSGPEYLFLGKHLPVTGWRRFLPGGFLP